MLPSSGQRLSWIRKPRGPFPSWNSTLYGGARAPVDPPEIRPSVEVPGLQADPFEFRPSKEVSGLQVDPSCRVRSPYENGGDDVGLKGVRGMLPSSGQRLSWIRKPRGPFPSWNSTLYRGARAPGDPLEIRPSTEVPGLKCSLLVLVGLLLTTQWMQQRMQGCAGVCSRTGG